MLKKCWIFHSFFTISPLYYKLRPTWFFVDASPMTLSIAFWGSQRWLRWWSDEPHRITLPAAQNGAHQKKALRKEHTRSTQEQALSPEADVLMQTATSRGRELPDQPGHSHGRSSSSKALWRERTDRWVLPFKSHLSLLWSSPKMSARCACLDRLH